MCFICGHRATRVPAPQVTEPRAAPAVPARGAARRGAARRGAGGGVGRAAAERPAAGGGGDGAGKFAASGARSGTRTGTLSPPAGQAGAAALGAGGARPPGRAAAAAAAGYFYPVAFAECAADLPSGARKFSPLQRLPFLSLSLSFSLQAHRSHNIRISAESILLHSTALYGIATHANCVHISLCVRPRVLVKPATPHPIGQHRAPAAAQLSQCLCSTGALPAQSSHSYICGGLHWSQRLHRAADRARAAASVLSPPDRCFSAPLSLLGTHSHVLKCASRQLLALYLCVRRPGCKWLLMTAAAGCKLSMGSPNAEPGLGRRSSAATGRAQPPTPAAPSAQRRGAARSRVRSRVGLRAQRARPEAAGARRRTGLGRDCPLGWENPFRIL